jgi:hypothetical protein
MALRARSAILCTAAALLLAAAARAQPTGVATEAPAPLGEQLRALAEARLLSLEAADVDQLRRLVARAEHLSFDGRDDEAVLHLLEALESPRFADFKDFTEFAAAEHMAGAALIRVGSLRSARRYLEHAVLRGPESAYYAPALRKLVDVALAIGDFEAAASWLGRHEARMPEDAKHELAYLRARAALEQAEHAGEQAGRVATERASAWLARVGKRSRFYGNAQYLLGVIAARQKRFKSAEQRFCAVAGTGFADKYAFYVDARFFEVQDLARLALGRTAHELRRGEDAFYYYFQVPRDSPRLSEALFEAAYASYEAEDHEVAVDLLDQLDVHAPGSPFADEATILRGYVALARCDFAKADRAFADFVDRYEPLIAHVDRLLDNRVRRELLYEALLAGEHGQRAATERDRLLFRLLRVDPEFYRLHEQVRALDAEAARAGHTALAHEALLARFSGSDRPRGVAVDDAREQATLDLERDLALARLSARAFGDELDQLRAARRGAVPAAQVAEHERVLGRIAERLHELERRANLMRARAHAPSAPAAAPAQAAAALLARDLATVQALPARVAEVRAKLVRAASARAEVALRELRARLFGLVRRARIGRIDAVMGSKRRIELQIESLAAGRFPADLRDPLRVQGLLADDEEYWPFEGEDWPDEHEERYDTKDGARRRAAGKGAAR